MTDSRPSASYSRQTDLGALRVVGRDARAFLHAQLTQDIADLDRDSTLAAWLNAQGRVRALFDVVPSDDAFVLVTAADNLEYLERQLGLFVLRTDVRLERLAEAGVFAVVRDRSGGAAAGGETLRNEAGGPGPALGDAPTLGPTLGPGPALAVREAATVDGLIWHRLGPKLAQVIGDPARVESTLADLDRGGPEAAELEAVRLGLPAMPAALRERYVPQMLNLDRLGAVSFDKGCYPGQEIVARTQNLGTVKRRLLPFAAAPGERPHAGTAVVDASGSQVGEVNRAAAVDGGYELLATILLDARDRRLALEGDGREVERLPNAARLADS